MLSTELSLPAVKHLHQSGSNIIKEISAILLVIILANAFFRRYFQKEHIHHSHEDNKITESENKELILIVEGMTCNHCSGTVKRTLEELEGINEVEVELQTGEVLIKGKKIIKDIIKNEIEKLGYRVK